MDFVLCNLEVCGMLKGLIGLVDRWMSSVIVELKEEGFVKLENYESGSQGKESGQETNRNENE